MLGYATMTLLAGMLKLALIAALVHMGITACRARNQGINWEPEVARQRRVVWLALLVTCFIVFN